MYILMTSLLLLDRRGSENSPTCRRYFFGSLSLQCAAKSSIRFCKYILGAFLDWEEHTAYKHFSNGNSSCLEVASRRTVCRILRPTSSKLQIQYEE